MQKTFLFTGKTRILLRLLTKGYLPDWKYLPRFLYFCTTALLFKPLRIMEWLLYTNIISKHRITEDPVFILGHIRSGTTHLHNLLSCDPRMAFPTTFDAFAPGYFLSGRKWLKIVMRPFIPQKREMDNMQVSLDLPQEEEFSILMESLHSFYFQMFFPRQAEDFFVKYSLFSSATLEEKTAWKKVYYKMIRKFSYAYGGRRLLIKNPVNTARISMLLELFPGAKFIYISRNPYDVFPSTKHLYKKLLPLCQLQKIDFDEVEANFVSFYSRQLGKYQLEKRKIPVSSIIEIKFEDLEKNPVRILNQIYKHLELGDTDTFKGRLTNYLKSIKSYSKNEYILTPENKEKINKYWMNI